MSRGKHTIAPRLRLACIRRWPSDEARSWAERELNALVEEHSLLAAVAIGSAVRPASHSADVDFVLIYKQSKPSLNSVPIDVDVRLYRGSEVENLLNKGNELLGWAVRFGQVVYEKDSYWSELVRRWRERVLLPDARTAIERAHRAESLSKDLAAVGDDAAAEEQRLTMLTHLARARLVEAGVFPASREELVDQLTTIGERQLAELLARCLASRMESPKTS